MTSHEAFGYLADAYGLTQVGILGLSPEAEPDPRRLAELRDLVEREGVTTIFTEELVSPKVAETLANEAGVEVAVLNPLESLTDAQVAGGRGLPLADAGEPGHLAEGPWLLREPLAADPETLIEARRCLVLVRPSAGPRGRRSRGARGRVRRARRTERFRQVDAAPGPARLARAVGGDRPPVRRAAVALRGSRADRLRAAAARPGLGGPGHGRGDRRRPDDSRAGGGGARCTREDHRAGRSRARVRRARRARQATAERALGRTAAAGVHRAGRSRASPTCSSSTSRSPASTPSRSAGSETRSRT